jgi:hypothetical protein
MPGTPTPNYGWPIPADNDPADAPHDFQALGVAIDTSLKTTDTNVATNATNVTANTASINALKAPPFVYVVQTTVQTLTTGTGAPLVFQTEIYDAAGMHSTTTSPSRLTSVKAGYYVLSGGISFAANSSNRRGGIWAINGAAFGDYVLNQAVSASVSAPPAPTIIVYLNVGDYVELYAFQDSTANLNTYVGTGNRSFACAHFIA